MPGVESIIESGGLLLIGLIIFAESGMLIGFFLPGDTLLFTAGFFAAQGKLPLLWLLVTVIVAAILGDNAGYSIGKRSGHKIFRKKDGIFFRREYIERSEEFYKKHGGKAMLVARFIPIVRTFAALVAGVGKMPRARFFVFDAIGAVLWGITFTLLGYWLGNRVHNIDAYFLPALAVVMVLSLLPTLYHVIKDEKTRAMIVSRFRKS